MTYKKKVVCGKVKTKPMSDATKAEKLLNDAGRSEYSRRSSIPPPPAGSGTLPFSLPPSLPKQERKLGQEAAAIEPKTGALANAKAKWVVVKDKCSNVLKTQGIAAVVVFVIVAGIMAAVNPPICQTKPKNSDEKPKRSIVKILIWATLAAALAMVIPLGIEYAKKKKAIAVQASSVQ